MKKTANREANDRASTRYSLLSRLHDWDDQESWREFFDTYWQLIYSVSMRSGLTETETEDVIQETVISVAKNLHTFKRDRALGSFKSWLRNIIRWRIADQYAKRLPVHPEAEGKDRHFENVPDSTPPQLEAIWDEEWQANVLHAALERVKRQVKEEHFLMFDRYVIKQLPAEETARTLGVSVGQVYLAKHRVSALLKKEIQALEERQ